MIEKLLTEINELNELETKSLEIKIVKFNEEFGEFSAEIIKMFGYTHKPFDKDHLIEEAADALQCLLSIQLDICKKQNIQMSDIFEKMVEKNNKWRNKIKEYTKK